jgi:hypothetical protein
MSDIYNQKYLLGILPGLLTGVCLILAYLLTHSQPTQAGGLFLEMADQLRLNGFTLFDSIPNYTANGIPFAYPPLGIYLVALLELVGIPPLTTVRVLPAILFVVSIIPMYAFSHKLFESVRHATIIGVIYASTPYILNAHLVAQGTTRSLGLVFLLFGLVAGIDIFRDGDKNHRKFAALLFGLTLLSHLYPALFFVVSYLVFYAFFSRDIEGLINGLYVGIGGAIFASPYLLFVGLNHGIEAFIYASGHGSASIESFSSLLLAARHIALVGPTAVDAVFLWKLFAVCGMVILLGKKRYFLFLWFISTVLFIGAGRYVYLISVFFAGVFVAEVIYPSIIRSEISMDNINISIFSAENKQILSVFLVALICVYIIAHSAIFVMGYPGPYDQEDRFHNFYDDEDREAMRWVSTNTSPDAHFLVQGQTAEWFPYFTNRTSVATPQGTEWVKNSGQITEIHREFSTCSSLDCINSTIEQYNREFDHNVDYLFIEKGEYVVGHRKTQQSDSISEDINQGARFEVVFENEGVMIVRVG